MAVIIAHCGFGEKPDDEEEGAPAETGGTDALGDGISPPEVRKGDVGVEAVVVVCTAIFAVGVSMSFLVVFWGGSPRKDIGVFLNYILKTIEACLDMVDVSDQRF